jgi:hypothetical protein
MDLLTFLLMFAFTVVNVLLNLEFGGTLIGLGGGFLLQIGACVLLSAASRLRHRRLMREWGSEHGVTDLRFRTSNAFCNPEESPWWMGRALYDLWGTTKEGKREHYYFSVTGAIFCLVFLGIDVTSDEDQVTIPANPSADCRPDDEPAGARTP